MSTADSASLIDEVRTHQDEIEHDILTLVDSESYSYAKEELNRTKQLLLDLCTTRLGEPDSTEHFEQESYGDAVLLRYEGTGNNTPTITFLGHYDTVWPIGILSEWGERYSTDDNGKRTISGPGIFDMKTGLVQAIWITKLLREEEQYPTIQFLFNGDEELGSPSSRPIIEDVAKGSDAVFVFESSANGKIKTARKGIGLIKIAATGVESHAGLDPDAGASAIKALMQVGLQVSDLADRSKGTTINVGLISGGTGSNVIAGKAEATVDIRVEDPSEIDRLNEAFKEVHWDDDRVDVTVTPNWNRPPMVFTEKSQELYAQLESAAKRLGKTIDQAQVGGASDANFVSPLGIPVLCGVGANGSGAHARHEFIYPDDIPFYIALLVEALRN